MSITPLAAALAARPVPPRTPTKDYADVWLPVTLGTLAVVLVLLGLLALGWRARRRAQAGIPAPAPVPTALYDAEPTLSAEGMHVGTVRGEDRLDRVAVHGLGLRSRAVLEVHEAGDHRGLLVLRPGAANLFIPAGDLVEAGLSAGIAGKFVEPGGLVAWGWRLGDVELTSAFRPDRPEDRDRLLAALQTIIDPAPADPAGRAGEGDPR
ncbi:PH-like domain-containing protein [Micrococcus luteus]|uniref:PH-like domain-containing protein n=1 Tax=Micrococcus luteus TaxID=1270 RepID=UPI0036B9F34B